MESITIDILSDIGKTIQLAVAPVFLLTGIAAVLSVLSSRLGRITDRARILERRINAASEAQNDILQNEIASLWQRINIINKSIFLCTISALLVCLVVVTLFFGGLIYTNLSSVIAVLFISAMLTLIVALVYFLREVTRATKSMKMGMEVNLDEIPKS